MLNCEKYRKEIEEIHATNRSIALYDGEVGECMNYCNNCDWESANCSVECEKWLMSEYKEPPIDWDNVPVDTPILVRNLEFEAWVKRHFAKYCGGNVYAWEGGRTSYSAGFKMAPWKFAKLAEGNTDGI